MKLVKNFDAFLQNRVNLRDTRIEQLDKRVEAVSNYLSSGTDDIAANFVETVPQGSYAHRTIINPVGEYDEFDADLLLHLDEVDGWEAEDYVQELYTVFRDSSVYRDMVSRKTRCVTIDYANEFHIDVVPYLVRHEQPYITNRAENLFELTNPEEFNAWLEDQNRITGGKLIKVIRLMKYLRDFKNTFSVKSVILTILLGERVSDSALWADSNACQDTPTALKTIMLALDKYLQENETMPSIDDPSCPTENFNHRWIQEEYANFRKCVAFYTERIVEAYDEEDREASKTKWRKVFGEDFGTYSLTAAKSSEAQIVASGVEDKQESLEGRWGIPTELDRRYMVRIGARLRKKDRFRDYELVTHGNVVPPSRVIDFKIAKTTVPGDYEVYWKVRNTGQEAIVDRALRGEVVKDDGTRRRAEPTKYKGRHYVEVYLVKDGICIAQDRHPVIIK